MPALVGGAKPGHLVLEPKWPFQVVGPLRIYARPFVNEVLADKPLLYWRQDESSGTTAADASGNGHTGTYGAGVTLGAASLLDADPDTAATYNDTSSAIITSAYNPFTAGAKLTFIGWSVLPNFSGQRELFGGLSNSNAPTLIIAAGGGQPLWLTDVAAGSVAWTGGDFPAAQTVFWALTYDDTSRVSELFIGTGGTFVSKGTKTSAASFNAAPGNLVLGTFGTNNGWLGTMDEFAVFGAVLSADRLQTYYNARLIPVTSAGGTANTSALTATLTFTGATGNQTGKALAAVGSFTGTTTRAITTTRTAILSFTGTTAKRTARALSGVLAFSGAVTKRTSRGLTGVLTFTGAQVRLTARGMTAILSFTGATSRTVGRGLSATLTFSGAATKRTARALAATLTFTGSLASGKQFARALTATLTFAGSTTKVTAKALSATLTFTGTASRFTVRLLTATLSSTGATTRRTVRALSGVLAFTGFLASGKQFLRALTATLSFTGAQVRGTRKVFAATLTFTGATVRAITRALAAVTSFSGSTTKRTGHAVAAAVAFTGAVAAGRQFARALTASVGFTGSVAKRTGKTLAGALRSAAQFIANLIVGGGTTPDLNPVLITFTELPGIRAAESAAVAFTELPGISSRDSAPLQYMELAATKGGL